MNYLAFSLCSGVGATLLLDLAMIARQRLLRIPLPDYGLVGRWIGHLARGRLRHERIAASPPVRRERLIGWCTHYATGIAFASLLPGIWGLAWIRHPTIVPALIVGFGTAAMPFLIMQPAMGAGIAASRTPRPAVARVQSLVTHGIFGLGLYVASWITSLAFQPS